MNYKDSKFHFSEEIGNKTYLHYSSFSNEFILLNEHKHNLFSESTPDHLEHIDASLFSILRNADMIIPYDVDENERVSNIRHQRVDDRRMYHVVVNTTLDCNLNCWYCYEKKIRGSRLSNEIIDNICRNIRHHHVHSSFSTLKLSFFGGEPFMDWHGIKELILYASEFCNDNFVDLILDFTTNATLISESEIDFLSKFRCHFQITLDGAEKSHNSIKSTKSAKFNCYHRTLNALRLINSHIPNRWVAIRINFDEKTLNDIDEILRDIDFLDRKTSYVIVKKVWQIQTDKIEKNPVMEVLQKLFDHNFLPDYYVMPKSGVCFAERDNQVLFNYDGGIFKCTTVEDFSHENALGAQNPETGLVEWNSFHGKYWTEDLTPDYCKECKWYGACLGPCNRQLKIHKGERICTFDAMHLSEKEYLMYLLKYNLLNRQLHK